MNDPFAVDLDGCRSRQARLLAELEKKELSLALLTRPESVQWLTGAWVPPPFACVASIRADGEVKLVVPQHLVEIPFGADCVLAYEAQRLATLIDDQQRSSFEALHQSWSTPPSRIGGEFSLLGRQITQTWQADWIDIGDVIFDLRRCKDPDELRMLARANEANRTMYEHARSAIQSGISELEMYNQLQAVATETLGERLTYFGQDFQCNSPGGPPRNRRAEPGELYILDLGVGFRGYRSDNCRTFCVDSEPTEQQQRAWNALADVFPIVESTVRPGASCRELFHRIEQQLAQFDPWKFGHHLGHGVGLAGHEAPRLNSNWNNTFQEGEFFTVEPGLYHEELRGGIRLEQNYRVTSSGVELLTDWPLQLS